MMYLLHTYPVRNITGNYTAGQLLVRLYLNTSFISAVGHDRIVDLVMQNMCYRSIPFKFERQRHSCIRTKLVILFCLHNIMLKFSVRNSNSRSGFYLSQVQVYQTHLSYNCSRKLYKLNLYLMLSGIIIYIQLSARYYVMYFLFSQMDKN